MDRSEAPQYANQLVVAPINEKTFLFLVHENSVLPAIAQ